MQNVALGIFLFMVCPASLIAQYKSDADAAAIREAFSQYRSLYDEGDFRESLSHVKRAYKLAEESLPESDRTRAALTFRYGENLLRVGSLRSAGQVLDLAQERFDAVYGKNAAELIPLLIAIGETDARAESGGADSERAAHPEFRRAVRISEKHNGKASVAHADVMLRVGVLLLERASSRKAKGYLEKSLEIYAAELGEQDSKTGLAAFNLGKYSIMSKRWASAEKYLLSAVDAFDMESAASRSAHLMSRAFLVHTYESTGRSDIATEHCLAIGRANAGFEDEEYEPVFRVAPKYPSGALTAGVSGYVDLSFTVDSSGFVRDPEVIELEGSHQFVGAAIEATEKWRYAPRFRDGEAVNTDGVKTRLRFEIAN